MITATTEKRRLRPYSWPELSTLPKRQYLVKNMLDKNAMSVLYGDSNSGKTFLALNISLQISLGIPWNGLKTNQGSIVYIATEGGLGISERLKALYLHNDLTDYPPIYVIPASVDLCHQKNDVAELIKEIKQLDNVKMIIVDTLSRAISGGNENSPDDMGAFIKNCDKIREATQAHLMIVHHSGKDVARGARGHSALRAAVDTEMELRNCDGIVSLEVKKQRDGKVGIEYNFMLKIVPLGIDDDGDEIKSCVLEPSNEKALKKKHLRGQKKRAYELLVKILAEEGNFISPKTGDQEVKAIKLSVYKERLREVNVINSDNPDSIRRTIGRLITEMQNQKIIESCEDYIWIKG